MNTDRKKLVIAIDGYSSCGKSTIAKDLARVLNYIYIDTGAMYRAVTLYAMRNGMIKDGEIDKEKLINSLNKIKITFRQNPETKQNETYLNGENVEKEIRRMDVSNNVSRVSTIKEVREYLVQLQREMAKKGGVVMDGRDIGTVVLPDADLKIFMTARPEVRAERRYKELKAKGENVSKEEIMRNIQERDRMDTTRKESPLRQAEDAIVLDNSDMTPQQQLDWILNLVNKKR
ncbi:MAG: (d)CMP kinase [Chlorobi bacterium]|nr:(d)CMP kinase [Chlorobiota bacterium]